MSIQQALALHQAGRLAEAEALYRQIVAAQPNHYHALHFWGVLRAQLGDMAGSLELVGRSLALKGDDPLAQFHMGEAQRALKRSRDAAGSYQRATRLKPDFAEAHAGQAAMLIELQQWDEALTAATRAVSLNASLYDAEVSRGVALLHLKRTDEALAALEHVIAAAPHLVEAYINKGSLLSGLGRHEEGLAAIDLALAREPQSAVARMNRANVLVELNRYDEAIADFQQALAADPTNGMVYYNLGSALLVLQNWQGALAAFDSALALMPGYGHAWYNRSAALWKLGRKEEALADCEKAVAIDPDLGLPASRLFFKKAELCDWSARDSDIEHLKHLCREDRLIDPMAVLAAFDDPELHFKAARAFAGPLHTPVVRPATQAHDRLRLAYLSPDFRIHPVGLQVVEVLEHHDHNRFEVFGICLQSEPDNDIRRRLKAACDHFHEAEALTDFALAQLIADLGIDIVVDLGGFTEKARAKALAYRPAPVSVGYLGFAGTTGGGYVDYILADAVSIPPEAEPFFSEKVVRLPHCYFPADTTAQNPAPPARADEGLPPDAFVFCSFNNSYKITPQLFDIWMRLITAVPGSVLWLRVDKPVARANLQREAAQRGVDPARLIFAERRELAAHLARIALADLFLDSVPYNAHTTCNNALWAGLPVLTCAGSSLAARTAASMLSAIGLPELIAPDLAQYEALALELARAPGRLAALRRKLAEARATSPLFDMRRLCRALEAAYLTMADRQRQGQKPAAFSVNVPG